MTLNSIISIVLAVGCVTFATMWSNSQSNNAELKNKLKSNEEVVDYYQDKIYELDSAYIVQMNKKDSAAKEAGKYKDLWVNAKEDRERISDKYAELKKGVNDVSLDSLAKYIVANYEGDYYKISKINDSLFVAFEDTTVEDIVSKHIDYREKKEVVKNQKEQITYLDSLNQFKTIELTYLESMTDSLKSKNDLLKGTIDFQEDIIGDCKEEVEEQRTKKWIGYGVAGLEFFIIITTLL